MSAQASSTLGRRLCTDPSPEACTCTKATGGLSADALTLAAGWLIWDKD